MQEFKIRCSAIGHIMTNAKKNKSKLLSRTAETYCKDWLRSVIYSRSKEVRSKYMEKGHIMEDDEIDMVSEHLHIPLLVKNEESKEDDYKRGTCDVARGNTVIDVKNSWDVFTFPFLETEIPNKMYEWQLQGYMDLYDKEKAILAYCLLDTPDHLIEREVRYYCSNNGFEITDEIYDDIYSRMTYSDIPKELRIKTFEINRDDDKIKAINTRVIECREYIYQLCKDLKITA